MKAIHHQRGIVAVITVLALFAILAMGGLALAGSHFFSNKARMQTVVDAAALAAAKVIDSGGDAGAATAAANGIFDTNAAAFPELNAARGGDLGVAIEYSNTLIPFAAGTTPEIFVRVRATNFRTDASLMRMGGVNEVDLRASAVAGPSPAVGSACNIAPMLVCGVPGQPAFGYPEGRVQVLKISSNNGPIGPGNFMLARLGGSGGSVVRENMAGAYQDCATTGTTVETQTGNVVGPVAQGMNTRFGSYSAGLSADDYPTDLVTRGPSPQLTYDDATQQVRQGSTVITQSNQLDFSYDDYEAQTASALASDPNAIGALRRLVAVPVANCTGANNGNSTLPLMGFACFFLLQPVNQSGQDSYVFGEARASCPVGGRPGPAPTTAPGPHVLQLYRDQGSPDS